MAPGSSSIQGREGRGTAKVKEGHRIPGKVWDHRESEGKFLKRQKSVGKEKGKKKEGKCKCAIRNERTYCLLNKKFWL